MTDAARREALEILYEIAALAPDIRLGQLFSHLGFLGQSHLERGLAYLEDDELLQILRRHRDELLARADQPSETTSVG